MTWHIDKRECADCGSEALLMLFPYIDAHGNSTFKEICSECYASIVFQKKKQNKPVLPDMRGKGIISDSIETAICGRKTRCDSGSKDCSYYCAKSVNQMELTTNKNEGDMYGDLYKQGTPQHMDTVSHSS